jgi:uncharacterized Zn finger protein
LQIERGRVKAMVSGSDIYEVKIEIATVAPSRWKAICEDCLGSIGSLVELLQGKLSKNVMERVCREGDGLFPGPGEIKMSCSCLDWAGMCKHVAAALYGAGARLDAAPDLLFTLRGVDRTELIAGAGADLSMTRTGAAPGRVLADDDVAALFGIEMASAPAAPQAADKKRKGRSQDETSSRNAKSSSAQPSEQSPVRASQRTKKPAEEISLSAPPAVQAIERRQKRAAAAISSSAARTAPDEAAPPENITHAATKTLKKTLPRPEAPEAETEAKSRRQNRTKAARWIGVRARKTRG